MTVVKWAWVHGMLGPTTHENVEEAAEQAWHAANREEESFYCLEIIGPNGSRIAGRSDPEFAAVQDRLDAAEDAEWKSQPKPTLRLRVRGPKDAPREWGTVCAYADEYRAWQHHDEWVALLGADRVKMELMAGPLGTPAVRPEGVKS